MGSRKEVKPLIFKYSLLAALSITIGTVCATFAEYEDSDTKMSDLISRIADLEAQLKGEGSPDDKNPGSQVTTEDFERFKEEMRATQDKLTRLNEDMNQLRLENEKLKASKTPLTTRAAAHDSLEEKPVSQKGSERPKLVHPSQVSSSSEHSSGEEDEVEFILNDLRQKSSSLDKSPVEGDEEESMDSSAKKKKKTEDIEEIRTKATKTAEEKAPKLPAGDAEAAYNVAFALQDKGEYVKAEKAFSAFIKEYPQDPLIPQALYWKGECCLQQKNFKDAKVIFVNAYKKNPKGPKAPYSLLRLGEAFALEGKKENAGIIWDRLDKTFPKMKEDLKTELAALRKKYGITTESVKTSKSASSS
jgi:tol-pal system protein YbgF